MGGLSSRRRLRSRAESLDLATPLLEDLTVEEARELERKIRFDWPLWARQKQLPPEDNLWDILVLCAGRGGGKTRGGSQEAIRKAHAAPAGYRMGFVGRTAADVRDTMILGESGILACSPPWFRPRYFPTLRLVRWPNGVEAHTYSADEPDSTRGPQHHFLWGDEFASWKKPDAFSNLMDGLRLGNRPQAIFTTTPRRTGQIRDTLLGPIDRQTGHRPVTAEMQATDDWHFDLEFEDQWGKTVVHRTFVRRWATEENSVNLAPGFAAKRRAMYGASSLGRQELDADIQEAVEGALWTQETIDEYAVEATPRLRRVEVAIDPTRSDDPVHECGIVVGGIGEDGHCYILDDCTVTGPPHEWALAAVAAYNRYSASAAVYETNLIGQQVKRTIRTVGPRVNWVGVSATEDKQLRAAPASALCDAGQVHHVRKKLRKDEPLENRLVLLEDELVTWDPSSKKSPNRLDAYVWLITSLMIGLPAAPAVMPGSIKR